MLPRWYRPPAVTRFIGRETVDRIARLHDVAPEDITGPSRAPALCEARRCVMRELRDKGWSTTRIGQLLNRDHSTIVHAMRRAR
jgi:ATPase involved in DNA replication initiation